MKTLLQSVVPNPVGNSSSTLSRRPEVVLFDVGNTLLFPNWERILSPLIERDIRPSLDQLRALERRTKNEFDEMVTSGRVDHGFWWMFYGHLLDELHIPDEQVQDKLTRATQNSGNWDQIRPGTREALDAIGAKYRIGVISNADGKIANVLTVCGICDCFLSVTDSGIVGHEKPHPAIFAAALQAMKVAPENALYVGDVYSVDYIGATRSGMQAVLMDVAGAYRDKGLPRVESIVDLRKSLAA
jgi:HAD superfamily hydrolase (TIGR01509 family)